MRLKRFDEMNKLDQVNDKAKCADIEKEKEQEHYESKIIALRSIKH